LRTSRRGAGRLGLIGRTGMEGTVREKKNQRTEGKTNLDRGLCLQKGREDKEISKKKKRRRRIVKEGKGVTIREVSQGSKTELLC